LKRYGRYRLPDAYTGVGPFLTKIFKYETFGPWEQSVLRGPTLARKKEGSNIVGDREPSQMSKKCTVVENICIPSKRSGGILTEKVKDSVEACFRQSGESIVRQ
jgi:hypothetical protein